MIVIKKRNETFEPKVGTLWVNDSGTVYFLHRALGPTGEMNKYQMTRLDDGMVKCTSTDKVTLIQGMCLCSCPMEIMNEVSDG